MYTYTYNHCHYQSKVSMIIFHVTMLIMINNSGQSIINLVGGDWNMTLIFPYNGNVIIPIDELIFFRGVGIPPTSMSLKETFSVGIADVPLFVDRRSQPFSVAIL